MALLAAILLALLSQAAAQPSFAGQSAVVQEILDGNEMFIDTKRAKVRAKAVTPQLISTANSRGQMLFNSGAIGRINHYSAMRLGDSCFFLQQGQVLISGKQNGCTQSARLSVRGTNYLLSINESGETQVTVLEGIVDVLSGDLKQESNQILTRLTAGERLLISPKGIIEKALKLTPTDYRTILNGPLFRGFKAALPGIESIERLLADILQDLTPSPRQQLPITPDSKLLPLQFPSLNP